MTIPGRRDRITLLYQPRGGGDLKGRGYRIFAAIAAALLLMTGDIAAASGSSFGMLPRRVVNGVTYRARPPSELTTVLLIGYDRTDGGQAELENHRYNAGGQADFLLLVVIDHKNDCIYRLQLDRDTMTDVKLVGPLGDDFGTRTLQLCLSHAYGKTQEENNRNTLWAVENLLGLGGDSGIEIDWYMTMDISGIGKLNDLLGGVTVTVNDDFSALDPAMVPGATLKLNAEQAQYFCRSRMGIGEQTNASRMVRQQAYMKSAVEVLKARIRANTSFATELLTDMGIIYDTSYQSALDFGFEADAKDTGTPVAQTEHYLMTNKSLTNIVNTILAALDYDLPDLETLPGVHQLGTDGHVQFLPEDNAALNWTLKTFYRPLD